MKWKACFLKMMLVVMGAFPMYAQQGMRVWKGHLYIGNKATVPIILPYAIKSVDRGSPDILAQQAAGVDRVLLVKAADSVSLRSNLTIITAGNYLFSFIVEFSPDAPLQPVDLSQDYPGSKEDPDDEVYLSKKAEKVADFKPFLHKKKKDLEIVLELMGLYVDGNYFFLQLGIANQSQIDYEVSQLRLSLKDKKEAKRTATQELEINPRVFAGWRDHIPAGSETILVVVVPKFSIQDGKEVQVQVLEKDGGRSVQIHFDNKWLRKAKMLNYKN